MRILIPGGHLTPALAFIEYVQQANPDMKIYFAGRKYARKEDRQPSREEIEVSKTNAVFIPFSSGKLGQGGVINKLSNIIAVIRATFQAFWLIPKYKPNVLLSFGGYLAVPLAIAAWLWRVPIITHEQTRAAGIANNLIAPLANKIALAYPDSQDYFPSNKTTVVGNPIRQAIQKNIKTAPEWFTTASKKPILYITGGSQGSEVINTTVARSLRKILQSWIVIHQCGPASNKRNYKDELENQSRVLSKRKQSRYFVRPWIDEQELAWIYSQANAIVARAGANSTAEITARQIPTIFIPLPFSHRNEQLLNAKALSDEGAAILLQQKDLSPETLLEKLDQIIDQAKSIRKNLSQLDYNHQKAAEKLYQLAEPYVS